MDLHGKLPESKLVKVISVFGSANPQPGSVAYEQARTLGGLLAGAGFAVSTGGYGGFVMMAKRPEMVRKKRLTSGVSEVVEKPVKRKEEHQRSHLYNEEKAKEKAKENENVMGAEKKAISKHNVQIGGICRRLSGAINGTAYHS